MQLTFQFQFTLSLPSADRWHSITSWSFFSRNRLKRNSLMPMVHHHQRQRSSTRRKSSFPSSTMRLYFMNLRSCSNKCSIKSRRWRMARGSTTLIVSGKNVIFQFEFFILTNYYLQSRRRKSSRWSTFSRHDKKSKLKSQRWKRSCKRHERKLLNSRKMQRLKLRRHRCHKEIGRTIMMMMMNIIKL